jgi:hypothetical protein
LQARGACQDDFGQWIDAQTHPESECQGPGKKGQAQVEAQPVEEQNQAEDDENFEQDWNGLTPPYM